MDFTVNNATTINNNLVVNNTSNVAIMDIDVTNATFNIDASLTVSNNVTFDNSITFNIDNTSNVTVFTVNGSNGNTTVGGGLTVSGDVNFSSTAQDTIKDYFTRTHSGVYIVTASDNTGNTGSSHAITATDLGFDLSGAVFYQLFLNRQLLRPTEFTLNNSNGTITFTADVLATDDEIEAVFLK
jgi:hypothetical protein